MRFLRRWRRSGRGYAETLQPVAGLRGFDRPRITCDEAIQFTHSGLTLAEFQQSVAFLQLRGRSFAPTGILFQHFVVFLHGGVEVALPILDVGEIELRVARE